MKKKVKRYIKGFPERIKGNITSASPTKKHDAINLAHELVKQTVQGKAARVNESNKRKWEEHQKITLTTITPTTVTATATTTINTTSRIGGKRLLGPMTDDNNLRNVTCYGCGEKGHLRHMCPKGRNQQNEGARGRAYVVVETPHQNPNVVTCTFLLNDHYASVLFDSGAERSFVSTEFTPFIDIALAALNTSYEVELADGKFVMRRLSVFPFRMARYLKSKVRGRKRIRDHFRVSRLMRKKHDAIHIVRDFPEVFLDDLTGLPPMREIEFRIDLIPGALPVVKSPYHLAPSEMLELSNQLKELQEKEVQFLGHVVNWDGIHVDPSKVESVKNWKTPESPT
ncbi:putative reverse transcriptase domain-containing protein [Tanacetum coccineum]